MTFERRSGILLHPTSLPGPGGIGEFGPAAYRWVDWLASAGQRVWQILPLGPTGYGDSPYASFSAFAGNPLLISLEALKVQGLLSAEELAGGDHFPTGHVDFGSVIGWKLGLLQQVALHVLNDDTSPLKPAFRQFCIDQQAWLDDYALFIALKGFFEGKAWNEWDSDVRKREPEAVARWRARLDEPIRIQQFLQFLFWSQWIALKIYANDRDIQVLGDIPIFVAYDSADVWANPEMFFLDADSNPTVVAGVPPDYFSATGQRWGNPLYRWDVIKQRGYDWWIARVRASLTMVDIMRIDHFRGFEAYWEVPAAEETAINGQWVKGPGIDIFSAMHQALGELPIVAEDLGVITPEVEAIRDGVGFPGMKVLQFAWGDDASNPYLPHNYDRNYVVYTGTHDNDTTLGWYNSASKEERAFFHAYSQSDGSHVALDFIRLAMQSVAVFSIAPLQDVLQLGTEAQMNQPGKASGNWGWRYSERDLTVELAEYLRMLSTTYGRVSHTPDVEETPGDVAIDAAEDGPEATGSANRRTP